MVQKYSCSQVRLEKSIGSGSFGHVYKGSLNRTTVAIKINAGEDWESVKEVNRMKWLSHPNIVSLLGIVPPGYHNARCSCHSHGYSVSNTWIIMDYMAKGNLHQFMMNYSRGIPEWGKVKVAYQVANGMWYLHKYANKVHMDLSARNVLVRDDAFNVKIGDFGVLCEYEYNNDCYYFDDEGNACPVRWMPPENFPDPGSKASYTRKGDVWAFGVLLFEIWTRGKLPFEGLDNESVMDEVREGNTVLDYCSKFRAKGWVKQLMNDCFEYVKSDRPNFRMIMQSICDSSGYDVDCL